MDDYLVAHEMNPTTQTNVTLTISTKLMVTTTMEQHKETLDSLTPKVAHDTLFVQLATKVTSMGVVVDAPEVGVFEAPTLTLSI
jgi:hypothetical protein